MDLILAKSEEELNFLFKARTNPEVDRLLEGDPPSNLEDHLNYISKVQSKSRFIYIAYENNIPVGYSQIYDITSKSIEVGFVILPEYQGRGLGKQLVKKTLDICNSKFCKLNIILYVKKENIKARHIYECFGFVEASSLGSGLIGMINASKV